MDLIVIHSIDIDEERKGRERQNDRSSTHPYGSQSVLLLPLRTVYTSV